MSPSDIFRMLKIAYPFLVSYQVNYSEERDQFDVYLKFSEDAPGHLCTFGCIGHDTAEEAIAGVIALALIA